MFIAEEWSNEWLLPCNKSKCHALYIWNKLDSVVCKMVTGDTEGEFKSTSCEKDIGAFINSKLNYDPYIFSVVEKANSRMDVIRRMFKMLDKDIFPLLFKAIIRPHLKYASSIWNPHHKWQIKLLEVYKGGQQSFCQY